jgi:hypothetical protein
VTWRCGRGGAPAAGARAGVELLSARGAHLRFHTM